MSVVLDADPSWWILVAALVLESVGPQEYDIRAEDFAKRLADSYGDAAAAEIKSFLPA